MDTFGIVIQQMGLFVIYIVIGVILVKTKVFNAETIEILARFVLKLALPLLIFTNSINGVDRKTLLGYSYVLLIAFVLYCTLFCTAKMMSKVFRLKGDRSQVYCALSMFGNVGFMGIPVVTSLFPENGMLCISVFTIIDQLMLWTVGVKLTSPVGKSSGFNPKKLINPANTAVVLAILVILTGIPVPGLLNTALGKIGAAATPLSMIYLGGVFACIDIRSYVGLKEFYGTAAVKMILLPVLVYLVLGCFPVSEVVRMTMAMVTGMPSMTAAVMMAKSSGSDGDYAMGGIFITTLCSIITLPLVCRILQFIGG